MLFHSFKAASLPRNWAATEKSTGAKRRQYCKGTGLAVLLPQSTELLPVFRSALASADWAILNQANVHRLTIHFRLLEGIQDLGNKPAVTFYGSGVAHDLDSANFDPSSAWHFVDAANHIFW